MEIDLTNRKNKLINKINATKACRINAFKRCDDWKEFLILISFIYNISLVAVSVLSIVYLKNFSVIISLLSVVVFAISLFISSLDFSRKANEYCKCYQALDELSHQVEVCDSEEKLSAFETKYFTIINFSINHAESDYFRYKFENPELDSSTGEKTSWQLTVEKKYRKAFAKQRAIKILLILVIPYFIFKGIQCLCRLFK